MFEEQLRVPLFIRPPGGLDARVDVELPISLIDLAPTMLELVGLSAPASFEGRSWASWMQSEGQAPVRPIIVDEKLDNVHLAAIIDGNDKLILDGQFAVDGTTGKYPEFKGNVSTVYAHPLSQGGASNSHYNGNAQTYMDVGQAMGEAMVELLK